MDPISAKKKILFVCTGNSCRSQIAHGLLNNIAGDKYDVFSAGLSPNKVHPMAIKVMKEIDIDISDHTSDHLDDYLDKDVDVVITTCDDIQPPQSSGRNEQLFSGRAVASPPQ